MISCRLPQGLHLLHMEERPTGILFHFLLLELQFRCSMLRFRVSKVKICAVSQIIFSWLLPRREQQQHAMLLSTQA